MKFQPTIFRSEFVTLDNLYGPGSGLIFLEDFICRGAESNLNECTLSATSTQTCAHTQDISVGCGPLRKSWNMIYFSLCIIKVRAQSRGGLRGGGGLPIHPFLGQLQKEGIQTFFLLSLAWTYLMLMVTIYCYCTYDSSLYCLIYQICGLRIYSILCEPPNLDCV